MILPSGLGGEGAPLVLLGVESQRERTLALGAPPQGQGTELRNPRTGDGEAECLGRGRMGHEDLGLVQAGSAASVQQRHQLTRKKWPTAD